MYQPERNRDAREACLLAALIATLSLVSAEPAGAAGIGCSSAAQSSNLACNFAAKDDLFTVRAICMDSPDDDLTSCLDDADAEYELVLEECAEIFAAQVDVCDQTSDAAHVPDFGAAFEPRAVACAAEPVGRSIGAAA